MDIWETLRERLDYASFVPTPRPDIERADLRRRDGTPYTMLKNPSGDGGAGRYLRLDPADVELFELMDGRRPIQEILVAQLERNGVFALDRLARLTASLRANGFFGEEPPILYEKLAARRAMRDPVVRASLFLRRLVLWDIARWSNADPLVDRVYRLGGWLAFTRVGGALLVGFGLYGLWLWFQEVRDPTLQLLTVDGSYVLGILALIVLQVISISVHEAGHALAIRHYKRRVRRFGVAMYYLFPCFYVDSTDMTLGSRAQRIVVSLAGPFAGLTTAAACAVAAAALPGTLAGELAFKGASLFVFQFVFNLLPILELDGYHVLVDAVDAPFLRQRAMWFVRSAAFRKLRARARWTREEIGLALFGVGAIVTSLLTLVMSILLWRSRIAIAGHELLAVGPFGLAVLAILILVFVGPLAVAVIARLVGIVRTSVTLATARSRAATAREQSVRVVMLGRVRFLAGLPAATLAALASHLRVERVDAGHTVITAGSVGDRFYLVRSGRLQAVAPDGTVLREIAPGEGFGELALLDRTPRTATVHALEPAELWSLDSSHFQRWVRDRVEVAARIRADAGQRQALATLPFFRDLEGRELDRIAARVQTRRYEPGEVVIQSGERGGGYYLIREGTASVSLPDGRTVRTLGPGDGFGELALIFGVPRTATVTAAGPLVVGVLGRPDFAALVSASGESMRDFRARTGHYVGAGLGGAVGGA
ncbi:MAG: putative peptide zinc metalloprotease protein [Chloroflexota bacterium]|jgi:CRP-like cAMP-binding protein/Zn-dependent protease|nr:putative peptide zinc metalloprotease protein [Chloroflexota bacterium]